ncbi:MAG TPA: hypothetical protein VIR27_12505 [Mycobacteriales bacterium]
MADYTLSEQGGSPVDLPQPTSVTRPLVKAGGTQQTLGGSSVMWTVARRRQWSLRYAQITDAEYDQLEAWVRTDHGLGPFEFTELGSDPVLVNVVSLDQPTITWQGLVESTTLVLEQVLTS